MIIANKELIRFCDFDLFLRTPADKDCSKNSTEVIMVPALCVITTTCNVGQAKYLKHFIPTATEKYIGLSTRHKL